MPRARNSADKRPRRICSDQDWRAGSRRRRSCNATAGAHNCGKCDICVSRRHDRQRLCGHGRRCEGRSNGESTRLVGISRPCRRLGNLRQVNILTRLKINCLRCGCMTIAQLDNQEPAIRRFRGRHHVAGRDQRTHEQGKERNGSKSPTHVAHPGQYAGLP